MWVQIAMNMFYRRRFESCEEMCVSFFTDKTHGDFARTLKMMCVTEKYRFAESTNEGISSLTDILFREENSFGNQTDGEWSILHENAWPQSTRLARSSGRLNSTNTKPNTAGKNTVNFEKSLRTPYTVDKKRPVQSRCGRTASTTASTARRVDDGTLLNISRLNLADYAQRPEVARGLFEYIFYALNETQLALKLVGLVNTKGQVMSRLKTDKELVNTQSRDLDWWWLLQKAKCLSRLGLFREAETTAKESSAKHPHTETYKLLAALALRNNQPLGAIQSYKCGLSKLPGNTELLFAMAHLQEELGAMDLALSLYQQVNSLDATNIEALDAIASHHYCEGNPEIAMTFYRRILLLGFESAELYSNLGLCAFHASQYDTCMHYFNQAVMLSTPQNADDVFFNIAHVGMRLGDLNLSYQCLRIALVYNNSHAEAYNNLGVVEQYRGHMDMAKAFYAKACELDPEMFEAHNNMAFLNDQLGDLHVTYQYAERALKLLPNNANLLQLKKRLNVYFRST